MGIISGSFTGEKTGSFGVDMEWSAEAAAESNISRVTVNVYIHYYSIDIGARTCTCTVDGITQTVTVPEIHHSGSSTRKHVAAFAFEVPHNSDGSKPRCGISASFAFNLTSSKYGEIKELGVSGTVALETIPRASVFTYVMPSVTLGNVWMCKWVPASTAFRYRLQYTMGDLDMWTGTIHPNTSGEYTHADALAFDAFATRLTGHPSTGTVTVILHTYSGETETGSSPARFTVTVPENSDTKPSFSLSAAPKDTPIDGLYIEGRSSLSVDFGAVDYKYGARYSGHSVTVNGAPYPLDGSQAVSARGNVTVRGVVTDSRGFSGADEKQIYVHPYRKPRVTGFVCCRCKRDDSGKYVQAEDGTVLYLRATREFDPLGGNNHCGLEYCVNDLSGNWTELEAEAYTSENTAEVYLEGFAAASSYTVYVRARDVLDWGDWVGSMIPTAEVDLHLRHGGKGAAFGGYAQEAGLLDVWWNERVRGKLRADSGINDVAVQALRFNDNTTVRVPAIGRGIALAAVMSNSGEMGVYLVGNHEDKGLTRIDLCERIAGSYGLEFTVVDSSTIEISVGHAWSYGWYIRNLYL